MDDPKRELQRIFEFVVKHGPKLHWANRDIKKFLTWAWNGKHLVTLYDGFHDKKRIAAIAVVWQTDHPENKYESFGNYDEREGDYLHVYGTIVHPEYRQRECLPMLLATALIEYPKVTKVFWNHHGRKKNTLVITTINNLGRRLACHGVKVNHS
jgi:hypothetical protein